MIINNEVIIKKFRCNYIIGNYIIKNFDIPLLSYDVNYVYFSDNEKLRDSLNKLPFIYKVWLRLL